MPIDPPAFTAGPSRRVHAARALPTPPPPSARTSLRIVRPPFDSAVRGGVQPASELRHVQRHGHERHVCGALAARDLSPRPPVGSSTRVPLALPLPHALAPASSSLCTSPHIAYALVSTRQRALNFNQPVSFDTSSVMDMSGMFEVRSAHALPQSLQSSPPPHRLRRRCPTR